MNITRIGLDIAKQVFQVHSVDEHEKIVLRKTLKRAQVLTILCEPASLSDRLGSRWRFALLGAGVDPVRP